MQWEKLHKRIGQWLWRNGQSGRFDIREPEFKAHNRRSKLDIKTQI